MDMEKLPHHHHHPLHDFSTPVLKWGYRRPFRYLKTDKEYGLSGITPATRFPSSGDGSIELRSHVFSGSTLKPSTPSFLTESLADRQPADSFDARIERIRAMPVDHLHATATVPPEKKKEVSESSSQPWKLSTRPSALKAPAGNCTGSSPPRPAAKENLTRSRRLGVESQIKKKTKLSVALSREEIAEDFFAITGSKPPRRPKKRAKKVQQQPYEVFPGLGISVITFDRYKVIDMQ